MLWKALSIIAGKTWIILTMNSLFVNNDVFFQSIVVPREDWYWPKTESNDEEDDENTEEQDAEENIDLTVSSTS